MSNIPDYSLAYHYRWEAQLHVIEEGRQAQGLPPFTLQERAAYVDKFVQANPKKFEEIVSCPVCQEKIAEAVLNGKCPWDVGAPVRQHLESLGLGKYVPGTAANRAWKKKQNAQIL